MKRLYSRRNRIFLALLLSFIIATLIPVALLAYIHNLSVSNLTQEVASSNYRLLELCQEQIESKLTLAENLVSDYAFDSDVYEFASHSYARPSSDLARGIRTLSETFNMNTPQILEQADILEIGLYSVKNHSVISRGSGYARSEDYFGVSVRSPEKEQEAEDLIRALSVDTVSVQSAQRLQVYFRDCNAITVCAPVFTSNHQPMSDAFVFCYLDLAEIADTLMSLPIQEGGLVYIADRDGTLLFSLTNGGTQDIARESDISISDSEYLILSATAPGGRKYVAYVPREVAVRQVSFISRTIVMVVVIGVLLSLLLAAYLAYLNAKPATEIHRMLQFNQIDEQTPEFAVADVAPVNYQSLKNAVGELITSSQNLSENYRNYLSCARADFIHRIVNGSFSSPAEVERRAEMLNLSLDACFYASLLVRYEGLDAPVSELDSHQFNELSEFQPMVEKYFAGTEESIRCYTYCDKPSVLSVMALIDEDDAEACQVRFESYVNRIAEQLNRERHISLAYICGGFTPDISQVGELFQDAKSVRNLKPDKMNRLFFATRPQRNDSTIYYSLHKESRLVRAVAANQRELVEMLIREIMAENFAMSADAVRTNRFCGAMHLTILRIVDGTAWNAQVQERAAFLLEMPQTKAAEEIESELIALFGEIMDHQEQLTDSEDAELMTQIQDYLKRNLTEPSLTLYNVAQEFRMPESTLYKFIRSESGLTFTALLEKCRMKHAADLLVSSDLTIDEVAAMCGYNSAHAFRRVFKKVFGTLPTAYRSEAGGQNGENAAEKNREEAALDDKPDQERL